MYKEFDRENMFGAIWDFPENIVDALKLGNQIEQKDTKPESQEASHRTFRVSGKWAGGQTQIKAGFSKKPIQEPEADMTNEVKNDNTSEKGKKKKVG